jgi:hypothetical protein
LRIAEKDDRLNVMVAEKNDAVTLWQDRFTAEEKARIRSDNFRVAIQCGSGRS